MPLLLLVQRWQLLVVDFSLDEQIHLMIALDGLRHELMRALLAASPTTGAAGWAGAQTLNTDFACLKQSPNSSKHN